MDRRVFMAILLSFVVVGLLWLTFAIFEPFLLAILWAAVLVISSQGLYERLKTRLGHRENLAAALMTLATSLVILVPLVLLGFLVVQEAVDVASNFNEFVEAHPQLKRLVELVREKLPEEFPRIEKLIDPAALVKALGIVGGLLKNVANLFFIVLTLFFLYRDGSSAVRVLRELLPLHEEDRESIFADVRNAVVASVRGGLLTAVVQGTLAFLIYHLLGVGSPLLWGAVSALASLIPLGGTALVWVPIAVLFWLDGDVVRALILFGYGVVVIGLSDNFLRPLLVGQHMKAHPLLLFFGILGGIAMFGFAGIILGPVSVAFLIVATRLFRREFRAVA